MKTVVQLIVISFFILIVGLVATAWYFSTLILQPGVRECSEEHYVFCDDPAELGLKYKNVSFVTKDNLRLSGWYVPGESKTSGIVMVHGKGADRRVALRYVSSLHEKGFNLLLFDLRNCGKSEKSFNSMGYHEKLDVNAAVTYLRKRKRLKSIGVYGFSMGAAAAILAMSTNPNIKAGIFESSFADLELVISEVAKDNYGIPYLPLVPLTMSLFKARARIYADDISPEISIAQISPRPIFIIHGMADDEVKISHAKKLYTSAKKPKKFWPVKNGGHTRAWQSNTERAEKEIPLFFGTYLK